jgi:glutamate synthase (NADPH/NADH) small chain
VDRAFEEGWVQATQPIQRTGKKVAVIGSGPAGLACAAQLNSVGHSIKVFERDDRIGGLLTYGIPNMKLDKKLVERRVDLMTAEGIEFVTGVEVGASCPAEKLMHEFDAVVLCGGATKPRDLPVEGRELNGIHFAMEYLTKSTKHLLDGRESEPPISAKDKDVIVIGGGDTGTDCVGTALRQGCRSLLQFEILPKPPDSRAEDNPWPEWPRILRVDYGQEEAKSVFGEDPREFSLMTTKFVGDSEGNVQELRTVEVDWVDEKGRLTPKPRPGTEKSHKAQLVFLALGFLGPENQLLDQMGVARDSGSNVDAEMGSYTTSLPGVFSAGDMRRGQSLIVWAIREGRGAARECDRFLMGQTDLP